MCKYKGRLLELLGRCDAEKGVTAHTYLKNDNNNTAYYT